MTGDAAYVVRQTQALIMLPWLAKSIRRAAEDLDALRELDPTLADDIQRASGKLIEAVDVVAEIAQRLRRRLDLHDAEHGV